MGGRRDRTTLLICFLLVLATLAVYWQVRDFGFVMLDDTVYVSGNPRVLYGLSCESVTWAFGTTYASNWHPLTWISLMTDAQIGRADAAVYHATNVALHIVNTLLLFAFLSLSTGHRWRAAAVAALFALHPLHVESVAWVTERKDVLSTMFWLLTMLAYMWYVRHRGIGRYLLVAGLFALGLMAKPMLVSLPLVLLLLDIWPLRRVAGSPKPRAENPETAESRSCPVLPLVVEKIPLFAMAAASCVVTLIAQAQGGSVQSTKLLPMGVRIANAAVAYVHYIGKALWPTELSALYAHPERSLPVWQVLGASLLVLLATALAIRAMRTRPYVTVGWLWYLVTLIPVIGLVQVGVQAWADRYTYVPLIGLFVVVAWGLPDILILPDRRWTSRALTAVACVVLTGLGAASYVQAGYWRSSVSLARRAVAVEPDSYVSHEMLAAAYAGRGKFDEAIKECRAGLAVSPNVVRMRLMLASLLCRSGRLNESAEEFKRLLKLAPRSDEAHYEAGILLLKMKQFDRALKHFLIAMELSHGNSNVYAEIAHVYMLKNDPANARTYSSRALEIDPNNPHAHRTLTWAEEQLARRPRPPSSRRP